MSERELFEHNFPKPKDIYWCEELNDYNYIDKGRGNPYAYDNLISYRLAWEAWQASANRQGYKLVPVEPIYSQLDALKNSCALFQNIGVSDIEANGAYKAMIGAVE